jgi:hypothetical protein
MAYETQRSSIRNTTTQHSYQRSQHWTIRHRTQLLAPVVLGIAILLWAGLVEWQQYPAFFVEPA